MDVFGNVFKRKRWMLARLKGAQRKLEIRPNSFLYQLEENLIAKYNEVLLLEIIWYQKSQSKWVQ
ncbi:hypothetical protein REPUB_Repub01dG0051900 [Reevesia pubescens]